MSKHSKGPWEHSSRMSGSENHKGYVIRNADGYAIAEVMPLDEDGIEGETNARLMAAAPEMLKEMKRFLTVIEYVEHNHPLTWVAATNGTGIATANAYRAAIAKAEGK